MKRIACTGPNGHVGSELVKRGVIPLDCNVTDIASIRKAIKKASPDIVINVASKTSPTWVAENIENYNLAYKTNVVGLGNLIMECSDIPIVTLSTDHIFPGKFFFDMEFGWYHGGPYKEDDKQYPINDYGLIELAMEIVAETYNNVKIVRTSNLFYDKDPRVLWYLDEAYKTDSVKVPTFQKRSFMHVSHFVDGLLEYVDAYNRMPKFLHISGSETVSWYTFLLSFCDAIGFPFRNKFSKKWSDEKSFVSRLKSGGLDTSLSAKLGITQRSYLDGMELLK